MSVETIFVPESKLHRGYTYRKLDGMHQSEEFKDDLYTLNQKNELKGLLLTPQRIIWSLSCPSHPVLAKDVGIRDILNPTTTTFYSRLSDDTIKFHIYGVRDDDIQVLYEFFKLNSGEMITNLIVNKFSRGWKETFRGLIGQYLNE